MLELILATEPDKSVTLTIKGDQDINVIDVRRHVGRLDVTAQTNLDMSRTHSTMNVYDPTLLD